MSTTSILPPDHCCNQFWYKGSITPVTALVDDRFDNGCNFWLLPLNSAGPVTGSGVGNPTPPIYQDQVILNWVLADVGPAHVAKVCDLT